MSRNLQQLILEGEHIQQDFKYCINDSKKIAISLVAFANTEGGRLLIGVKDNGKIVGISSDEEYYMVESAAQIYSKPKIPFETKQWVIEGKTVLEVTIEPSTQKPHYAQDDNGKWLAFIRVHDENKLAHKIQLEVWKKERQRHGVFLSYSDVERSLIRYLTDNKSITFSKFIRQARIHRKDAEEILSNLVTLNVVTINYTTKGVEFRLNEEMDTEDLLSFD